VPSTAGRSHGRQGVRSGTRGAVGEHLPKIMTALITGLVVIAFTLVMTKPGQDIDAATQRFMLFYAGVFALIGLTASVGVGLVATDRIIMTPGRRVMAQAVHRAVSFGALAFLIIHIVTEILAQRVHVIDAFIPFLSPYRTFYIGLGTIASDLLLLIVVTSIVRKRFTAHGKAWRWRAIHYSSYLAFVFGVLHGLLGGRAAKPYVDWSYGFAIALTALAVAARFLAISLRSKDKVSAAPGVDRAVGGLGYSGTSPLRSAALSMAQSQLGATIQMLPAAAAGAQGSGLGLPGSGLGLPGVPPRAALPPAPGWAALPPAPGWSTSSGSLSPFPAGAGYAEDSSLMPLGAPVYEAPMTAGTRGYPFPGAPGRQPRYEPEYDGPPRFEGASRKHLSQDDLSSYPYAAPTRRPGWGEGNTGPLPLSPPPRHASGPMPRTDTGPLPRLGTGPTPRADSGPMPRLGTGPVPRADSGPMPRLGTGPVPRTDSGPLPRLGTGPRPRADSGPLPRLGTGPRPRTDTGPMPRIDTGLAPRPGTGPMPRADSGPMPRLGTGPMPRTDTGPMPRLGSGPMPIPGAGSMSRADSGPMPRSGPGPVPRPDTGPVRRPGPGPASRADTGPMPRIDTGPRPRGGSDPRPRIESGPASRTDSGPMPRLGTGPVPRADSGPMPRLGTGPRHGADYGSAPRNGTGPNPRATGSPPSGDGAPRTGTGPVPSPDPYHGPPTGPAPATVTRRSRRTHATDPRYRDTSGRPGGDEWR
jgi:DMSO/TMAO reductase YedYZ heme-binding membrane subunit